MIVGLAQRIGISHREVETWDMEEIREHIAILTAQSKKDRKGGALQTPEEVERGLVQVFGPFH